jgi:hypothetical protein
MREWTGPLSRAALSLLHLTCSKLNACLSRKDDGATEIFDGVVSPHHRRVPQA